MGSNVHNSTAQETDITSKSRDEFINFLDSEINSLRSEIQRPGWTTWAILGGIAALVWLLFSEIEIGKYSLRNVAGLVFVIWLFSLFCINIASLINPTRPLRNLKERFLPGNLMSTGRPILFLLTGLQIFFIFVAIDFSPDVGSLATILACFVIFGLILALAIIIFISFTNTPIPLNITASTPTKIGWALSAIVSAIILFFYIKFLLISPGIANIYDVRFAMLIVAIFYLVLMLLLKSKGSLTLDSLITIRREFFLGRLDLNNAKLQVDIALTGLDASVVFEEYVSKFLSLLRDSGAEYDKCTEHLEKLERLYSGMKGSPTKEQMLEFKSGADSIKTSLDKVTTIVTKSLPEAFKPLQRRIYFVSVVFGNPDIFKDIRLKINNAINHVNQQREDFSKKLDIFLRTIEKRRRTAKLGQPDGQSA